MSSTLRVWVDAPWLAALALAEPPQPWDPLAPGPWVKATEAFDNHNPSLQIAKDWLHYATTVRIKGFSPQFGTLLHSVRSSVVLDWRLRAWLSQRSASVPASSAN
ncbi:hypothetical protein CYMTET_30252 [Cymbomonas tetramitiformis]|uniref:Uncharacterized protein n=1 Tax=Cymbomonas tetramitiformis TaxID=36881 RepID=A0AAE0FJ76_9CHLO|nr:hypothetical protein CYMTET_30252 [Cymbomonas tetramitiformis]